MSYQQLNIQFSSLHHDELDFAIELMQAEGMNCCSFTIQNGIEERTIADAILEPAPGETPLWDNCNAQLIFLESADKQQIKQRFQSLTFPVHIEGWEIIEDKPWEREWLQYYQPILIGNANDNQFWVSPHHQQPPEDNKPILWLDPGLAFGTGSHETTYLCLEWLASQQLIKNTTIVDFGCGSGILALAALVQGADFAYCHDIDPQALTATNDNGERNQIAPTKFSTALDYSVIPHRCADIVFANILFEPLKQLASTLHQLCTDNGQICLSGLISSQVDDLIETYKPFFKDFIVVTKNDWVRISAVKC